jgi:hypothetical protein
LPSHAESIGEALQCYLLMNGTVPSDAELAQLVRASTVSKLRQLRDELVERGVLSKTADGVLYSRKMVRAAARSKKAQEVGKLGGNPALCGGGSLTSSLTKEDNPQIQRPDPHPDPNPRSQNHTPQLADRRSVEALFEQFWSAYPRKVGKKAARAVWSRIWPAPTPEFTEIVIAAIRQHAQSRQWRKDDGQFIPHPKTWLSHERWLDQVELSPAATATASDVPGAADTERYLSNLRGIR